MSNGRVDPLKVAEFRTQDVYNPEDLWQPLYDTVNHSASGSTQLSFFSVAKGGTATLIVNGVATANTVKGYYHTNIEQSGVVPNKLFKIIGVSIAYLHLTQGLASNAVDRDRVRNAGVLHFKAGDKDICWLPLAKIPESNPFVVASSTVTATTILATAGGGGYGVPMYRFGIPVVLEPFQGFSCSIDFPAATTLNYAIDIQLSLEAYMRRPS